MSKHVEIFKKIVSPSNASIVQKNDTFYENSEEESNNVKLGEWAKNQNYNKRQCVEILNCGYDGPSSLPNVNNSSENYTNLPEYKSIESKSNTTRDISYFASSQINFETQGTDFIAYLPSVATEIQDAAAPSVEILKDENVAYAINEKDYTFDVDLHEDHEQQLHSMDIMLADYIQTDLLPLETLEEIGFCKYNQQLTGLKLDDNTIIRVKRILETRFKNLNQIVKSHVSRLSQSKPYALSFEVYKDNEEQDVLNIYFNYLKDNKEDIKSFMYTSCTICTEFINISELLNDINLNNCSGVVVSSLETDFQSISEFANVHGWL